MVMTSSDSMRISKSQLKARMLEIFRQLEETGQEALVTDRGRVVLKIVPVRAVRSVDEVFADLRGKVIFHQDPDLPTEAEWPET
jgi:antitoxin (DNA-binding transcriptional repressor) of toxin-antitoxin stability system